MKSRNPARTATQSRVAFCVNMKYTTPMATIIPMTYSMRLFFCALWAAASAFCSSTMAFPFPAGSTLTLGSLKSWGL